MARTNLSPIRIRIAERDEDGADPDVQIAYSFTTSDGDTLSKTREGAFDNLSAAQQTAVTDLLTSIKARIKNVENIA